MSASRPSAGAVSSITRPSRISRERQIEAYSIRPADSSIATGLFSGGNQQKAIVARELAFDPRVLIIAQPTRGLDVSAAELVHGELMRLRRRAAPSSSSAMISTKSSSSATAIAVIYDGEIVADLAAEAADRGAIGLAMTAGRAVTLASTEART